MIRSVIFNLAFYVTTALFVIVGSPLLFGPRSWAMAGLKAHAITCLTLQRLIVGTDVEIRGRSNLPDGPLLIAAKHQSAWDTFALIPLFSDPALIMKAELRHIPFYGWFSRKFEMIFVARSSGPSALRKMVRDARECATAGRQIIIFPEGTRRAPDDEPDYKPGVLLLYEGLDIPCVPVALNSGLFWPRRKFMRYPGTIVVEFLDPLQPGLPRNEFKEQLEKAIEQGTAALVEEARGRGEGGPPQARTK